MEAERKGNMGDDPKKDEHKYTAEIEKLEKEMQEFQRQWEKDKKKAEAHIEKIEKQIDQKKND
jgi:hypothetical protein